MMLSATVFEFKTQPLYLQLRCETMLSQARTVGDLLAAADDLIGQAPDRDVLLALWQQAVSLKLSPRDQHCLISALDDLLINHAMRL